VPDVAALIGQAMLVVAAVLLVIAVAALVPRVLRVRRRARAVEAGVAKLQREGMSALALLEARAAEREALLLPYRRLLRWAGHPLVAASIEWYARHRRRRRDARAAHG
jgi:hypothetical protein